MITNGAIKNWLFNVLSFTDNVSITTKNKDKLLLKHDDKYIVFSWEILDEEEILNSESEFRYAVLKMMEEADDE